MKVEYNEETAVRKSLSFEIEAEVVKQEIEARARDYARKAKIPGFRPGKIPAEVIKRRFKSQVLEDVAEKLVNKVVYEEIEGRGLKPLAVPKVVDLKIDEDQPLTFRAVFETLPLVQLPEYRGLKAKARKPKLSEQDVDKEIDRLRESAARYDPVEGRAAQAGDFALCDVAWRPAEGGRARRSENALIEVGGEGNDKELNAALVGVSQGETRHAKVTRESEDGKREALDYTVTLRGIKQKVVPPADDDFAKDLGEFASLAELREDVRKRLLAAEERRADREAKNALLMALVDKTSMEVPEALIERHMTARTENAARGLALQGVDPTKLGVDWQSYRDGQREDSLKAAKADILLDEIARREGIEASEAELDAELSRYAERTRKSKEALRAQLEKEGELRALRARLREEKVLDLLKASATLDFE